MHTIRVAIILGFLIICGIRANSQTNLATTPKSSINLTLPTKAGNNPSLGTRPFQLVQAAIAAASHERRVAEPDPPTQGTYLAPRRVTGEHAVLPAGGGVYIQPQSPLPTKGLVLFYDMYMGNNSAVLSDKSSNGFDGAIGSPNPESPARWVKEGLAFDGVSNCAGGIDGDLVFGQETIRASTMIVFYREASNKAIGPLLEFVADEQGGNGPSGQMGIVDFAGLPIAWFQPAGSENYYYWANPTNTSPGAPGTWHSFGFTWIAGHSAKLYWDNLVQSQEDDSGVGGIPPNINLENARLNVGCDFPGGSYGPQYSDDTIAAALIYNRSLSQAEMSVVYDSMKAYLTGRSINLP